MPVPPLPAWSAALTPASTAATSDILLIARLPATVPMGLKAGDQLRLHGRFFNRRKEEGDDFIGEIHAEQVVLIARNQLRRPRANGADGSAEQDTHEIVEDANHGSPAAAKVEGATRPAALSGALCTRTQLADITGCARRRFPPAL
jgi:hypothetical protein